jgi:hypothetical protein
MTDPNRNIFIRAAIESPRCFSLYMDGEMLVEIYPDGTMKFGPGFTTEDEASLEFWRILAEAFPAFRAMLLKKSDEVR